MVFKKLTNIYLKYKEMTHYIIFGGLTTVVNWVVYQVLIEIFKVNWSVANVIAWICAVIFAYITNRKYVFESTSSKILKEFFIFVQFRILSLLLEMVALYILIEVILLSPIVSKMITVVIVVVANYIFSKLIIFKEGSTKDRPY